MKKTRTIGKISRNSRPHLQTGQHSRKLSSGNILKPENLLYHWPAFKEALFREYPKARKPFVSLADLGLFVDEKSKQEIHTLDEYAAFHREFRRLATRVSKEKSV